MAHPDKNTLALKDKNKINFLIILSDIPNSIWVTKFFSPKPFHKKNLNLEVPSRQASNRERERFY